MITIALLMLAADAPTMGKDVVNLPAQQPQTVETAMLKLAIARAENAFNNARAEAAEAKVEARRIEDEAKIEAAQIEKKAQTKMQTAREQYMKLIRELKGWREGCATDEAQNLKCPSAAPEAKKP